MRILRWLIAQLFGFLVTLGLAAGIAVGIQALLPLMTTEWIDDRSLAYTTWQAEQPLER